MEKLQNKTLRVTTLTVICLGLIPNFPVIFYFSSFYCFQNTPFVIMKSLDVPKETLERMSFEEKYEGYVLDLVKHLSEEVTRFLLKSKLEKYIEENYVGS